MNQAMIFIVELSKQKYYDKQKGTIEKCSELQP